MNTVGLLNQTVGESQLRRSDFSFDASSVLNGRSVAAPAGLQYAPHFCSYANRDFPLRIFKEAHEKEELAKSNWEINAAFASAIASTSLLLPGIVSIAQSYNGDHFNNLVNDLLIKANGENGDAAIDRICQIAKTYRENYGPIRFLQINNTENLTLKHVDQIFENFTNLKKLVWQARFNIDIFDENYRENPEKEDKEKEIDATIAKTCALSYIQVLFQSNKYSPFDMLSFAKMPSKEERYMRLVQTGSITSSDIVFFVGRFLRSHNKQDLAVLLNQLFRLPTFDCNIRDASGDNLLGMFFRVRINREDFLCAELLEIMINLMQRADFEINALNSHGKTGLDIFNFCCEDLPEEIKKLRELDPNQLRMFICPNLLGPQARKIANEIGRLLISRGAKTSKELEELKKLAEGAM